MVGEGAVELVVPAVAAAGDEDDDPEEGRAAVVALVRILFAEDGEERVEVAEESVKRGGVARSSAPRGLITYARTEQSQRNRETKRTRDKD